MITAWSTPRFNRTILECKDSKWRYAHGRNVDLIEPYWNVKTPFLLRVARQRARFNRTILECKGTGLTRPRCSLWDLIEPYWNVKDCILFQYR